MECWSRGCSRVDAQGVDALMQVPCRYKSIAVPFFRSTWGGWIYAAGTFEPFTTAFNACASKRKVAGGLLYGITDVKKLITYYFFEISSIWAPQIYPWGVGMGTSFVTDRRTFAIGSFPVLWIPSRLQIAYAHQGPNVPYQALAPNPYIPDVYVSQEELEDVEMFDFFQGKEARLSYYGQEKLLREWAEEYKICELKYKPPKPSP